MWSKCPTKAASFSHREKHAKTYQVGSQQHHTMVTTPIIARRSWAIEIVPSRDSPVREGKHEQTCPNHQSLRQLPNLEQKSRCFFYTCFATNRPYIDHCIPKESAPERFPRFPTMHPRSLEKMAVRPPKAISAVADVADIMGMSSFTVHKYG